MGHSPKYHRAQIRRHFGFRECSVAHHWLAAHFANAERDRDKFRAELFRRCQAKRIESPTPDRVTRIVRSALLREREREVTDSLVDLLIATVHRIGARAEQRVTKELVSALQRVTGKENIR